MVISFYYQEQSRDITYVIGIFSLSHPIKKDELLIIKNLYLSRINSTFSPQIIENEINALCEWDGLNDYYSHNAIDGQGQKIITRNVFEIKMLKYDSAELEIRDLKKDYWKEIYCKLQHYHFKKNKCLHYNEKISYHNLNEELEFDFNDVHIFENSIGTYCATDDVINYLNLANVVNGKELFKNRIDEIRSKVLEGGNALKSYLELRLKELIQYVDYAYLVGYLKLEDHKIEKNVFLSDLEKSNFHYVDYDESHIVLTSDINIHNIALDFKNYYVTLQEAIANLKNIYYNDNTNLTTIFVDSLPLKRGLNGKFKSSNKPLSQTRILLFAYLRFRSLLNEGKLEYDTNRDCNESFKIYFTKILEHMSNQKNFKWNHKIENYETITFHVNSIFEFVGKEFTISKNNSTFNFTNKIRDIGKLLKFPPNDNSNLSNYFFSILSKTDDGEVDISSDKITKIKNQINETFKKNTDLKNSILDEFEVLINEFYYYI